ncbi:MAG: aminotransferase [Salinarimonadaceae bacterium]|nr:MAG: aminotransferase [Salinarimonadaceae bacterium]
MRAAMNPLVAALAPPPIPQAQGWAHAYDGSAGPLINLTQAAPGSAPHPDFLARLAEAAGSAEAARYGAIAGDTALREAYAADVAALYAAAIGPENVAITAGCNQAFAVAALLAARAGDAVLLPTPWYFNHQTTLAMLGVEAVPLPARAEDGFVPRVADAEALIDPRTRAIALVTPNNPTGAIYPPETIAAFADLARRRGIWLILDETYRDFLPEPRAPHGLFAAPGWGENVVQLYSFSKSYAAPGLRLGAMTAAPETIEAAVTILDNLQICPARAGQAPIAWAIPHLRRWREENRAEILARARAFAGVMARHPGWRIETIGVYFAYLRHPSRDESAAQIAERLARERGVLTLPGSYFGPGQEAFLRIAFANADPAEIAALDARLDGFG